MLKKVLFVIVALGAGLLLFLVLSNILLSASLTDIIGEVNESKDYTTVERMYVYFTPKEEDKLNVMDDEGFHYEAFSAVRVFPVCSYNESEGKLQQDYTIFRETFEVAIFNIGQKEGFKQEDSALHNGKVVFVLSDDSEYTVYLNNTDVSDKDSPYFGIDFYGYITGYQFLPVSLVYSEIDYQNLSVKGFRVYDGDADLEFMVNYDTPLSLVNKFDQALDTLKDGDKSLRTLIAEYNEASKVAATSTESSDTDNQRSLLDQITSLTENTDLLYVQVGREVLMKRPKFIIWAVVVGVLYIGVVVFIGYFVFKKKKGVKNLPKYANIPPRDHAKINKDIIDANVTSVKEETTEKTE